MIEEGRTMGAKRYYKLTQVLQALNIDYKLIGRSDRVFFSNFASVFDADVDSLTFISHDRNDKQELIKATRAGIVICDRSVRISESLQEEKCFVLVDFPKLIFVKIGSSIHNERSLPGGIHPTSIVDPRAGIHPSAAIGPFCSIGECEIGEGTIIYGHVHVFDQVTIGRNVIINPGCVLGSAGFGFLKTEGGDYVNFPHLGGILIEDYVEIGANTCVDRGALGNTVIRKGAKIDNFVHVAHNVEIGENAIVIAHAMIGGSTRIGRNAWIAPSACLRDCISIGQDSLIGLGAVVTGSVPDGQTWAGSPAREMSRLRRMHEALDSLVSGSGKPAASKG